ncbi:cyclophilin-like protein [Wallemia mellicola]|nr:cyclophilin-like protein [Wallemia mellicola]TIC74107.1 cyclophilin-like protein [Wallemia mellicola]
MRNTSFVITPMSSIYNLEPYTNGKVVLQTTVGDIELELWGKECPKAVRNFIALSLEGYYDGCIFHRVVPDFIVQTGDPTGTGRGGESFYGEPFETEPHQRLRFNRRGLVGMAHSVDPDTAERDNRGRILRTNTSQFFITMSDAMELTGTNTLFGRIVGDTIFNALKIQSYETDADEKPLYPPKIKTVKIVINPFEDIVPRITRAERKAQAQAKADRQREREEELAKFNKKKLKKKTALLSFGDEATEEEAQPEVGQRRNVKSSHDLLDDKTLSKDRIVKNDKQVVPQNNITELRAEPQPEPPKEQVTKPKVDLAAIRKEHSTGTSADVKESIRQTEEAIEAMKSGKKPSEKMEKKGDDDYSAMLEGYKKGKPKRGAAFDRLKAFKEGLRSTAKVVENSEETPADDEYDYDKDTENDSDWMNHQLHSSAKDRLEEDQSRRAEVDYDVIDPRQFKRARKHANPNSDVRQRSGGGAYARI